LPLSLSTEGVPRDTPKESYSTKQSSDRAKELEQQRLQNLRNNSNSNKESASARLRMPLFGAPAVLQARPDPPSLPPKVRMF